MEVKGKITAIPPAVSGVSSRGPWRKVFIVVEYESGQYPKRILLSNMNKAEEFGRLRIGDVGTFKYDHSVSDKNGKYFMDTNCWSWTLDSLVHQAAATAPASPAGPEPI